MNGEHESQRFSEIKILYYEKLDSIIDEFSVAYNRFFSRDISRNFFNWYDRIRNIWAIARNEQKEIVGIYGLLNIDLIVDGESANGFLAHNTAVAPDYRGSGFFQWFYESVFRSIADSKLVLGFPNHISSKAYIKRGWKQLGSMVFLSKRIKENRQEGSNKWKKMPREDFINVYNSTNKKEIYKFSLLKNAEYIDWRYQRPNETYYFHINDRDSSEYFISKKYYNAKAELNYYHVVDFYVKSHQSYTDMLSCCEQEAKQLGQDLVNICVVKSSSLEHQSLLLGYEQDSYLFDNPVIYYTKDNLIENVINGLEDDDIFLTLGDNDVF